MRCTGALLVVLGACSFEHGQLGTSLDASIDAEVPAHCLDGYCLRKAVRIRGTDVTGSHQDFMLLVRTAADAELAAASTTGQDIRFTTSTGQPLAYERQRYDASTGQLVAWVKLPALTAVDTTIYLWYGKAGATEQQDPAAAWAPDYAGVWHLDEAGNATSLADASGNSNTGMPLNASTRLPAQGPTLGGSGVLGAGVSFDGVDDEIDMLKSTSLSSTTGLATITFWINWTAIAPGRYQRVFSSSNRFTGGVNDDGYELAAQDGGNFFLYPWGGAEDYNLGLNPFTAGAWQYFVATLDFSGPSVKMYVDGAPMPFTVVNEALWTMQGDPGNWCWGSNPTYPNSAFGGGMDEIRVMRGAKGPAWVETSFANQKPGSTMVTIGAQQMLEP